ncbi:hypothetical protein [Nocardioides pyridinolyticus]
MSRATTGSGWVAVMSSSTVSGLTLVETLARSSVGVRSPPRSADTRSASLVFVTSSA